MALIRLPQLGRSCLDDLRAGGVEVPGYDLEAVSVGHAHIGPGVFHRGHQAMYAERALAAGHSDAAICAISMRSSTLRDVLARQDHLYMCITRDGPVATAQVIGSIREVLVAADDAGAAVDRLADPALTRVTTTVTEAGHCFGRNARVLDRTDAGVIHDLADPTRPVTMPGLLVAALARRRSTGVPPFAIVPCDNIVANGDLLRDVLRELAAAHDEALAEWIADTVPFCSTMVDRMVPTTSPGDRQLCAEVTGVDDGWPVVVEPFSQWVVQRHPDVDLRAWEHAGAQVVDDVVGHEQLKLRVLNGAHSALAYAGLRRGRSTVAEALADSEIAEFVSRLLRDEILPTVVAPEGVDVGAYARTVLERFANVGLSYATTKVAGDGSLKLAQRLLPTAADRVAGDLGVEGIATVFATWLWCVAGPDAATIGVSDPIRDRLLDGLHVRAYDPDDVVDAVMVRAAIFGEAGRTGSFVDAIRRQARAVWPASRAAAWS